MSIRKNRRALMAELLLLADPADIRSREDGVSLSINFDSIAELRSWLHLAGLDGPDLVSFENAGVDADGRSHRIMNAFPTWHGWEIFAYATEYTAGTPLDPDTVEQLSAVAVTA